MSDQFIKRYQNQSYKYTTMVRHKGVVIAFAMNDQRQIFYTVLDLAAKEEQSPLDGKHWSSTPMAVLFPNEISEVGIGVAGQTLLPVVRKGSRSPVAPGVHVAEAEKDLFLSTTARLTADAPFQVLSDGRHIFIFRQAIDAGHVDQSFKRDAEGNTIRDAQGRELPLVDSTLLVDRFVLSGTTLQTKLEVRYQRSRNKTVPQSRKDSLGAKDLDEQPFYEPTQELRFVRGLQQGRFSILLLPTGVAGVQRWQIFAHNSKTGQMDAYNVERAADGLFNTRGSQAPNFTGYAESALAFDDGNWSITLKDSGVELGDTFTLEAWIYPTSSAETQALITAYSFPPQPAPFLYLLQGRAICAGFREQINVHEFVTEPILTLNTWQHLAITCDGTAYYVYVNGEKKHRADQLDLYVRDQKQAERVALKDKKPASNSALRGFGKPERPMPGMRNEIHRFGDSRDVVAMPGMLDEIRLWRRARGQSEIGATLHQRLTGLEPGLSGYWRFDEASGNRVDDQTDAANHGMVMGGRWVTSTAPVGENSGLSRHSFRFAEGATERAIASGPTALLYYPQEVVGNPSNQQARTLKRNARVMLAVATQAAGDSKGEIAVVDLGVAHTGRLAQIPDRLVLRRVDPTGSNGQSVDAQIEAILKLEQTIQRQRTRIKDLGGEISTLHEVSNFLEAAIYERPFGAITFAGFSDLKAQVAELQTARTTVNAQRTRVQELEDVVSKARITAHRDANYRGGSFSTSTGIVTADTLKAIGFHDLISSFEIPAPLQVTAYADANRLGQYQIFTESIAFVGTAMNDRISSIEIGMSASFANQHQTASAALRQAQEAATAKAEALVRRRGEILQQKQQKEQEKVVKESALITQQTELQQRRGELQTGQTAPMPLLATDPAGLSITGGLLSFAQSQETPLLFDSATGKVALYFRGGNDQFLVAYYATKTQRAQYTLRDNAGAGVVDCFARSTEAEMDQINIKVKAGDSPATCTVIITGPPLADEKPVVETWSAVPRAPAQLAKVLNGQANERAFVGSGTMVMQEDGQQIVLDKGLRRSLAAGATLIRGQIRLQVRNATAKGALLIPVESGVINPPTEPLPLFFVEYDYARLAQSSQIPTDLRNGSSFIVATPLPDQHNPVQSQEVRSGTTLMGLWSAATPGYTLAFDGASHAQASDATAIAKFTAPANLTLESWVYPSTLVKPGTHPQNTIIVQQGAPASGQQGAPAPYLLGLERKEVNGALAFNGSTDSIQIDETWDYLNFAGEITLEAWIKPTATNGLRPIISHGPDKDQRELYLRIREGYYEVGNREGANSYQAQYAIPVYDQDGSEWVHLAGVYDGTAWRLYRNGAEVVATNSTVGALQLNNFWGIGNYGNRLGSTSTLFQGTIDEVRIWQRARTAQEIADTKDYRLNGDESGLAAYWRFDRLDNRKKVASDYAHGIRGLILGKPVQVLSPLAVGYHAYAAVGDKVVQSPEIIPGGHWTHLAAVYTQSYALEFNPNQASYLDCGNDLTLDITGDLTLEVGLQVGAENLCGILSRGKIDDGPGQDTPYALWIENRQLVFAFEDAGHINQIFRSAANVVTKGAFYRFAVTRELKVTTEGGKVKRWYAIKLYNGATEIGSFDYWLQDDEDPDLSSHDQHGEEPGNSNDTLEIGRVFRPDCLETRCNGIISEVRIWNVARPPESLNNTITGAEKGLVSWWRCEENAGAIAFDAKSSNHGKFEGLIKWVKNPDAAATSLTFYRDGVTVETKAAPLPLASAAFPAGPAQFTIGALQQENGALGNYYQGQLEEVRIWQVARTQEQIQDNLFGRLQGEKEELVAYYTFDPAPNATGEAATNATGDAAMSMNVTGESRATATTFWQSVASLGSIVRKHARTGLSSNATGGAASNATAATIADYGLRGNQLTAPRANFVFSTAPIGEDTPQVRNALSRIRTPFHGQLQNQPAVQEYGDMQYDADGNLIGVLKRCYALINGGQWQLITGFKVGNLRTEWIGQVQTDPQLFGYIEGAPPVPSENLTATGYMLGEFSDYQGASTVELTEAEQTTYTYSAEKESGFDMSIDGKVGLLIGAEVSAGIGLNTKVVDVENVIGVHFQFENTLGWLESASSGTSLTTTKTNRMALRGSVENDNAVAYPYPKIGRRYVPDNMGYALVQSATADIFALRLQHTDTLVSYQMRPNPDIPTDWNILTFPINRQYTKQGVLDGKVGLDADPDFPNALNYSPDSSYFKPIEAYALKNRLQREEEMIRTYYQQYDAGKIGRRQASRHFSDGDLAGGDLLNKLPKVSKRNLVNTYVWTADGGLFAETQETMDVRQESLGGSYAFKGMAGLYTDLNLAIQGVGFKLELDALFGGHLNLQVNKSQESATSFGLNVALDQVEGSIYWRTETGDLIMDGSDPRNPKPKKWPGKVDAYRFMTFYLEPKVEHFDLFFDKVVDPIWLEQSPDPNAAALRQVNRLTAKPKCWRLMHRVTFVSRILPEFSDPTAPPLERSLKALEIDSNYELIKLLEPFVINKLNHYADFAAAIRTTIAQYQPELQPHTAAIIQYMSLYYGITDNQVDQAADYLATADISDSGAPLLPTVDAGPPVQVIGVGGQVTLQGELRNPQQPLENLLITWHQLSGPTGVTFTNQAENPLATTATFHERGIYRLQLTVNDGLLAFSDEVEVKVNSQPQVVAGADLATPLHTKVDLVGLLVDDGLADRKSGAIKVKWTVVNGPDQKVFANDEALRTTATFTKSGVYLLRLTASNDSFAASDELLVTVAGRVTRNLQALYGFKEGQGLRVRDVATITPPGLPLEAPANAAVRWNGGLVLEAPTTLSTTDVPKSLLEAMRKSNELTVEAWIKPTAVNQNGLARIITLAKGPNERNFILGQRGNQYYAGVRTNSTDKNAADKALAAGSVTTSAPTHLVCTRTAAGQLQLYVNGELVGQRLVSGAFDNWDDKEFRLALGNEVGVNGSGTRAWLGAYHLVALYDRALTLAEVQQNFGCGAAINLPPIVMAGPDQTVDLAKPAQLQGALLDDRLAPERVKLQWTQASGPSSVTFADATALNTTAAFTLPGRYELRLTADDGELLASDELVITVNAPPQIEAGEPRSLVYSADAPVTTRLQGKIHNDGVGDAKLRKPLTMLWSKREGPDGVSFTNTQALDSTVSFKEPGQYVLQLTVNNGYFPAVVATTTLYVNKTPVIQASADPALITLPASATLKAKAEVGLADPEGKVEYRWEKVSGPGNVTFDPANALNTTASFTQSGVYLLKVNVTTSGTNYRLSGEAQVPIVVNGAPVVDAGADQQITLPARGKAEAELEGSVSDDGLPEKPGKITVRWSMVSGPATVEFTDKEEVYTMARFSKAGTYLLQLTAKDYEEATPVSDTVTITVA